MTPTEYQLVENSNTNIEDKVKIINKYLNKEKKRIAKVYNDIMDGASEEFKKKFVLFPIGKIQSPVRIPCWMLRSFPDDPDFELTDLEKVALAHVIHFTTADNPYGYLECSGDIENWCKCSKEQAHSVLELLMRKNMIFKKEAPDALTMGHSRKNSYVANIDYLHTILTTYDTDIWV